MQSMTCLVKGVRVVWWKQMCSDCTHFWHRCIILSDRMICILLAAFLPPTERSFVKFTIPTLVTDTCKPTLTLTHLFHTFA